VTAALALLLASFARAQAVPFNPEPAIRELGGTAQALEERKAAWRGARDVLSQPTYGGEALFPGAPADQPQWHYLTKPLVGAKAARAKLTDGWRLNSLGETKDSAGFFSLRLPRPGGMSRPPVDRQKGFTLRFTLSERAETHTWAGRAGMSVIVIGEDLMGVELGFWKDEVWAQTDSPLFQHGEGAAQQTGSAAEYALKLSGDRYELSAGGRRVLEGALKNYSSFGFPYDQRSFLFFGDDTSSAAADSTMRALRVEYR